MTAAQYRYTVVFDPEPEGGFTVTCPALPGLVSYGESLEEARAMATDAIQGYLESLRELGRPIPSDDRLDQDTLRDQIAVSLDVA